MKPNDSADLAVAAAVPQAREAPDPAERLLLQQMTQRTRTPLIIERPEGELSARRLTNYVLTFLWWTVWGHFMVPLLTLLLWMSGFRRFSEDLLGNGGLDALVSRLPLYGTVVGVLCGGLITWALLNWWRFADRERRRACQPVASATVARHAGLDPDDLARWQACRRLVVLHDAQGRLTGVVKEPPADRA
jgi:poly-beta-1,6-N-acetyl-D-glucosamine biosynthesis protein PgaD